jgi:hypothetical protein
MYEYPYAEFSHRVDDALRYMQTTFGYATSQVVFSRLQHNGKPIPVRFSDNMSAWYHSTNLFPRRRIINSTIKFVAMALKSVIATLTDIRLTTPVFHQDRELLNSAIRRADSSGGLIVAIDQSRFDLHQGGDKMAFYTQKVLRKRYERIFGPQADAIFKLSMIERDSETIIPTPERVYAGDGRMVLKSGTSGTSDDGSMLSLIADMTVTREALGMTDDSQVNNYYLKYQPVRILGDDQLKLFPNESDAMKYLNAFRGIVNKMGLDADLERPSKFLGQIIVNSKHESSPQLPQGGYLGQATSGVSWIQPLGSIAQKTALPERFRSEPYPLFAVMVKFFAMPYKAFTIKEFEKADISQNYMDGVKKFITDIRNARAEHLNTRSPYFDSIVINFPDDVKGLKELYRDVLTNPEKYKIDVEYDADEILNLMFKGLEHDVQWSVLGLDNDLFQDQKFDTLEELVSSYSPDDFMTDSSKFVYELIKSTNSLRMSSPSFIQDVYNHVITNHRRLNLRHSPGQPIW